MSSESKRFIIGILKGGSYCNSIGVGGGYTANVKVVTNPSVGSEAISSPGWGARESFVTKLRTPSS